MRAKRWGSALRTRPGSYTRGDLPMKLNTLPAFTDNTTRMLHAGAVALRVGSRDAARENTASAAKALQLAGILVTSRATDGLAGDCRTVRMQSPDR